MADKNSINEATFLYGGNASYIENLYAQYEADPASVDIQWQEYFSSLAENKDDVIKSVKGASWQRSDWPLTPNDTITAALDGDWSRVEQILDKKVKAQAANKAADPVAIEKEVQLSLKVFRLIDAYRRYGHLKANIDPLGRSASRGSYSQLDLVNFGLSDADLSKEVFVDGAFGANKLSIASIINHLENIYCGSFGAEFMHISDPAQRLWLQKQVESFNRDREFGAERKKQIFAKLVEAEGFEQFLDAKYKGAKRFGLDGGESLIPALSDMLSIASKNGVDEVVFGMAHRGRLNVLSHILGKEHKAIFHEFMGGSYKPDDVPGSGDVKYHLGASKDYNYDGKNLHVSLLPNPSHLEMVNPVVMGKTRARQDILIRQDEKKLHLGEIEERSKVLPVLLHGDAAFAGQGIVQEVFAASSIKGYTVAGSLHVIINNQVGFTTDPECSRCTVYSSDVSKMIDAPVFHVNGDDTEAVVFVTSLALLYRQAFKKPVIVDLYCYRRFGHNEGDEPSFTQPLMYRIIRQHKTVLQTYSEKLIAQNIVDQNYVDKAKADLRTKLEDEFAAAANFKPEADWLKGSWAGLKQGTAADINCEVSTGVELNILKEIAQTLVTIPSGFNLHKTIKRFIENREKMLETGEGIDWATAEALAFGSLLLEGYPIRISGEDVERGTFSQRHSVVYDQETKAKYTPLNNLKEHQCLYEPVNSLLSEEGVLGYEYGYSLAQPKGLVIWEAQFGDFANGAQVVFDQFISSAETKWLRMSGLVCLLPHGFEGQGPEHSSARLERFLQLCAEDNMQVANCTTPANYFHILRRQLKRDFRKPLIMMTPKSLLRHKKAQSTIVELSGNSCFKPVLLDDAAQNLSKDIRRVVLCSGKVYYDLLEEREKRGIKDIYILRVEQLYPFPAQQVAEILAKFKDAELVWCQEEPRNMGAWSYIEPHIEAVSGKRAKYAGRLAAASPAVGLASEHVKQLNEFLEAALG